MTQEYPTVEEVMDKRNTQKVATWISPALYRKIRAKSERTGVPVSWVLRRALELWAEDELILEQPQGN